MPEDSEVMLMARKAYFATLPLLKTYRPGKYTAYGPGKSGRTTLIDLQGPGSLRRLWTTHKPGRRVRLFIFVDGQIVIEGAAEDIAEAAQEISEPGVPCGGLQDELSSNIYLPVAFRRTLRIEAESLGEMTDAPYWQIDYALDDEGEGVQFRQSARNGRLHFSIEPSPGEPSGPGREKLRTVENEFELIRCEPGNTVIEGPAVIRRLEISSPSLESLILRIGFDDALGSGERLDGPFQVEAPLRYLAGNFHHAGVERLGDAVVIHFPMPFRKRCGIQLAAVMDHGRFFQAHPATIKIVCETDPPGIEEMLYFHARYRTAETNGYDDFECCSTSGRGHFVGVHIFDTGHDHGGGDSIMFDSGAETAGQLHGICGEDYFHMAYMHTGNRTPYSGCPSHASRYRHHLEMPVPFQESFVFNWGSFAGQPAKAVAFWYQDQPSLGEKGTEITWQISGPFSRDQMAEISPLAALPANAVLRAGELSDNPLTPPGQSWPKTAQRGFVDLSHLHRKYILPIVPSSGFFQVDICTVAQTAVWAPQDLDAELWIGCDDPINVFHDGTLVFEDAGRLGLDPFKLFRVQRTLHAGLNRFMVVVANTENTNCAWNGFSFRIKADRGAGALLYLSPAG